VNYDALADQYPILNSLMGIASQMQYGDSLKKLVVLGYIGNILDELKMPGGLLIEYKKVMGLPVYEEEIA
jgi:hypothetical protein